MNERITRIYGSFFYNLFPLHYCFLLPPLFLHCGSHGNGLLLSPAVGIITGMWTQIFPHQGAPPFVTPGFLAGSSQPMAAHHKGTNAGACIQARGLICRAALAGGHPTDWPLRAALQSETVCPAVLSFPGRSSAYILVCRPSPPSAACSPLSCTGICSANSCMSSPVLGPGSLLTHLMQSSPSPSFSSPSALCSPNSCFSSSAVFFWVFAALPFP